MAATQRTYGKFWQHLLDGTFSVNWTSDTIRCMLLTSGYTPNVDSDTYYSDISANEVANGNGYTTKGVQLGTMTVSYDSVGHQAEFHAAAAQWTSATFTWRYAAVFKDTGTGTTSPLICYFDPGGSEQVTAGTTSVTFDATGVFRVPV